MSVITIWEKPREPIIEIKHEDCVVGLRKLQSESIHLTFTSPPYFNARDYSHWDTYESYLSFLRETFKEVFRVMKRGRMCVINISPVIVARKSRSDESIRLPIPFHIFRIMEEIGWVYLDDIVWVKPSGSVKNRNGGFYRHRKPVAYKPNVVTETILVFQKPSDFLIDKTVRSYAEKELSLSLVKDHYEQTNVWKINPETHSQHPAPFPVELSDRVISYYSFFMDTVLDPFLGSGTTLVSCLKNNRSGIGFEIHQKYIDMAKSRLQDQKRELKK